MAALLEHYGLIGDTITVALISRAGSLDWLCLPRIDSDACFAKMLGTDDHGYWTIRPTGEVRAVARRYREDTLILETEITCDGGRVRLVDFMPPGATAEHDVIRIVEGIEGTVQMYADLKARFAYGRLRPWIRCERHQATLTSGPDTLALRSPVPLQPDSAGARVEAEFVVRAGDRLPFTLMFYRSHQPHDDVQVDAEKELARTERFWREWASRCRYRGRYREAVIRSLITLKALTHAPTGGIVAAPTASLPEELGGVRNWDYRYGWLRDSTLTLDALMCLAVTTRRRAHGSAGCCAR
jgi:GH15 family glucan-1,4-alpha-glucosidase